MGNHGTRPEPHSKNSLPAGSPPVLKTRPSPAVTNGLAGAAPAERVETLIHEGQAHWQRAEFCDAEELLRKALSLTRAEELGKPWQALVQAHLAELHSDWNRLAPALQLYDSSLELLRHPDCDYAWELRVRCANNLGGVLRRLDRAGESERAYIEAANLLQQRDARRWEERAVILSNLGALYHAAGHYDAALTMHQRALEYHAQLPGNPAPERVDLHRRAALAAMFAERNADALQHLDLACTAADEAPDVCPTTLVELLTTAASLDEQAGSRESAEARLLRAVRHARRHTACAQALPALCTNLGALHAARGSLESARDLFEEAIHRSRRSLTATDEQLHDVAVNLSVICTRLGDAEGARRHAAMAEDLFQRMQQAHDARHRWQQARIADHAGYITHRVTPLPENILRFFGALPALPEGMAATA